MPLFNYILTMLQLDDYLRLSTSLGMVQDRGLEKGIPYVGIEVTTTRPDADNVDVGFEMYFCNPTYYNEEEIRSTFYSGLSSSYSFPTSNKIVPDTFELSKNIVAYDQYIF